MQLSNLTQRILSAVVLAPLVIWAVLNQGVPFAVLIGVMGLGCAYEWWNMTRNRHVGWKLLGMVYIVPPIAVLLTCVFAAEDDHGRKITSLFIVSILCLVWASDIGGYVFGRLFGKQKLAPSISPGKTVEGAVGAILFVTLGIALIHYYAEKSFIPSHSLATMLLTIQGLGIAFSAMCQLGDLFESWVKRHMGVKDSGNLIPGHGGMLDRVDALLFVLNPLVWLGFPLVWWLMFRKMPPPSTANASTKASS